MKRGLVILSLLLIFMLLVSSVSAFFLGELSNFFKNFWNKLTGKAIENLAPSATLSAKPLSGEAPLTVSFIGNCSDPENNLKICSFDFGDNSVAPYVSENGKEISKTTQHIYREAGSYTVILKAIDGEMQQTEKSIIINVIAAIQTPTPTPSPSASPSVSPTATASPSASPTAPPLQSCVKEGTVCTDKYGRHSDFCSSEKEINKFSCVNNLCARAESVNCGAGMVCSKKENKCVKEEVEIDTSLVAYWKFDEAQRDIARDSANANHGTIYRASWQSNCISGSCLSFDGDDFINVFYNSNLDFKGMPSFTLSVWVYKSDLSSGGAIISRWLYGYSTNQQYLLEFNPEDKSIKFSVNDVNGYRVAKSSANSINANEWHYVVAVVDHGTLRVYIDGLPSGTTSAYGTIKDIGRNSILIGSPPYFNGLIDELKVWNRALTDSEIKQEYEKLKPAEKPEEPEEEIKLPNASLLIQLLKSTFKAGEQVKLR